jgi:hypothetical protein
MQIRIIGVPPGEAPEWVRRAWVGLALPLAPGETGPRTLPGSGVLSGPRGCVAGLAHLLLFRVIWQRGYVTDAARAVWLLAEHAPEAAAWWHEHVPHAVRPGRHFIFAAEVCREEPDGAEWPLTDEPGPRRDRRTEPPGSDATEFKRPDGYAGQ